MRASESASAVGVLPTICNRSTNGLPQCGAAKLGQAYETLR